MTDIDAIRKRHKSDNERLEPCHYSTLKVGQVDALFAALDTLKAENERLKKEMDWENSLYNPPVALGKIKELKQSLAAAEKRERELKEKVERVEAYCDKCIANDPPICKLDIFLTVKQLLGGEK